MDDDLGVGGRLEDRAAAVQFAAQLHRVGDVAVMGDREAARGEFGEERLDVAQRRLAGGRIADMADRGLAGEAADDVVAGEIACDMAPGPVALDAPAFEPGDPARALPARL